ncbi:hypothetical protein L210DRAFT_3549686 [Boletus edulis BED1]|uniref:TIP49 P-loop domain-containing protein n=1 Tax=Boletus edulis BED1 TaxID=1328754 RepID=A0AAD4BPL9_BOLED|nr:hypothetical protein L210DRAFT_3549686 [Boletus edulis BED1]
MAPTVIPVTNRCSALVRGTADVVSPYGIPVNLLDRWGCLGKDASYALYRCLIVKTNGYNREQTAKVVQLHANVVGLSSEERLGRRRRIDAVRYLDFMTSRMCEAYELDSYALLLFSLAWPADTR